MTRAGLGRPITVGVVDAHRAALGFAVEEARLAGCDLQLVHAYTVPPSPPRAISSAYGIDIDASFVDSGRAVLAAAAAFVASRHPDLTVRSVLEAGAAPGVLARVSETSRLLVLGPDDATPWYSRLFRSRVSRTLAHEASCPVVVVPDTWVERSSRDITLLLDSRTVAHGPLRFAFERASRHDDVLHVLHVQGLDDDGIPWHDMRRLIESWQATYPHVLVDTAVVGGVADVAMVESFERTGVLVLGRPHGDHLPVPMHDSLAQAVIARASCPVAVVPPDYDV
ncbi:MAG: universal stress protein [Aeromicrobium sp.]